MASTVGPSNDECESSHEPASANDAEPDQQQVVQDSRFVSVECQTEPNLIDKLVNNATKRNPGHIDLYQDYIRDAQCTQFWPLDKNPIRAIVPSMLQVDLPEQHLKNESLMYDLVQAIRNNSKLVNLLAKYLHHIVPNVIISKRIDLIPLITCTIRVCDDSGEQERLLGLLFNLIKRPNEEQRRMILSGLTVVLQVSPQHQLLPNLWDHVDDKFPERRVLLAESCATLAHYVLAEFYLSKTEEYLKTQCGQETSDNLAAYRAKMVSYLIPYVFSDTVHSCAWLTKSRLSMPDLDNNNNNNSDSPSDVKTHHVDNSRQEFQIFDGPTKLQNKLLEPTMIVDEPAIVAFHDQLEQEHNLESIDWVMRKFLPRLLDILVSFSRNKTYSISGLSSAIAGVRLLCLLFGKHLAKSKIRPFIRQVVETNQQGAPLLYIVFIASLTSFEPIEQCEFELIVLSLRENLSLPQLGRQDVETLALAIKIIATDENIIHSPSTRQKFLAYILDALVTYSNQIVRSTSFIRANNFQSTSCADLSSSSSAKQPTNSVFRTHTSRLASNVFKPSNSDNSNGLNTSHKRLERLRKQTQTKEFLLIIFRQILSCITDQTIRPTEWAQILVTKFLPILIMLANDSSDVHVCTYARLMCAQLVETFDNFLSGSSLTQQAADSIRPALNSLKSLTEQIQSSNLKRQIECLSRALDEKFSIDHDKNNPKLIRSNTID